MRLITIILLCYNITNVGSLTCEYTKLFKNIQTISIDDKMYGNDSIIIQYECKRGFKKTTNEKYITVYCINGEWILKNELCEPKKCLYPKEIKNGKFEIENNTLIYGSSVKYECDNGYSLVGQKYRYCYVLYNDVATWSGSSPKCVEKIKHNAFGEYGCTYFKDKVYCSQNGWVKYPQIIKCYYDNKKRKIIYSSCITSNVINNVMSPSCYNNNNKLISILLYLFALFIIIILVKRIKK
nr:complement decay-accelerating factor-like protein [Wadden Sea poxvirus]